MTSVARREEDSGDYSDSPDVDHNNSTNDGEQAESDYGSQGSDSEHSDQDPESQETERRVDDDEDRSNPQYIPKRGTFYEHDDRTAASGEESANTTSEAASEMEGGEPAAERRRARKSAAVDRWSHDKYNETEQVPKSRDELVSIYGYDIRNEDAPPHARRNRRYGRGPNKYTRTWEDEEAYRRQAAAQPRRPPAADEFPELQPPARQRDQRRARGPRPRSKSQPASTESLENGELRRNASIKARRERPSPRPAKTPPKKDKMPPIENLTITAVVGSNSPSQPQRKVNAAVAQQRPVPTEQGKKKPPPNQPPARSSPPPAQPPTHNESRGGSKRYSSLRQRPLADSYSPQQAPQAQAQAQPQPQAQPQAPPQPQAPQTQPAPPHRYHAEYPPNQPPAQHQGAPPMHAQQMMHQAHRAASQPPHGPSPPHALPPTQVRLGALEPPAHAHAHASAQAHAHAQRALHAMVGAAMPPAQGYAPPAMMPAQYMQPSGNGAVYGGAVYAAGAPYAHAPLYPHHNYVPQATQAGGVTYYSPVEQEPPPPAPRARRPTAAIPIVRPDRPAANPTEKDNIDRIVENMFVRKPWPATQPGVDGGKEKSQDTQSKESSLPNSLTSSSISTDSKPSEREREIEPEAREEDKKPEPSKVESTESISTDA